MSFNGIFKAGDKVKIRSIDHVFTLCEVAKSNIDKNEFPLEIKMPLVGAITFTENGSHCNNDDVDLEFIERPKTIRKMSRYRFTNLDSGQVFEAQNFYTDDGFCNKNHLGPVTEWNVKMYKREKIGLEIDCPWDKE